MNRRELLRSMLSAPVSLLAAIFMPRQSLLDLNIEVAAKVRAASDQRNGLWSRKFGDGFVLTDIGIVTNSEWHELRSTPMGFKGPIITHERLAAIRKRHSRKG